MTINEIKISGYRSISSLELSLSRVNIITGHNGCGKSNLYRAIYLIAQASKGQLTQTLADEGGLASALWAGEKRQNKKQPLILSFQADEYNYEIHCGLPIPDANSAFNRDPAVKEEYVWNGDKRRKCNTYLTRKLNSVWAMNLDGKLVSYPAKLIHCESVIAQLKDPHLYPELSRLHQMLNQWRFYHHFRTDPSSIIRTPQVGIRTPVLHHDGRDLAASLRTIMEIGYPEYLHEVIDRAFPGSQLMIKSDDKQRFEVLLKMPGVNRPLEARELSDGTLRYLCLVAALLSPRPSSFLALNEPETSLHKDLLPMLADLIADAAQYSQILITTHSTELAHLISEKTGHGIIQLRRTDQGTQIESMST